MLQHKRQSAPVYHLAVIDFTQASGHAFERHWIDDGRRRTSGGATQSGYYALLASLNLYPANTNT